MNRQLRRANTEKVIRKRVKQNKNFGLYPSLSGHYYAKWNGINCGNPGCLYCINERRLGKLTIQELKSKDIEKEVNYD